MMDTNTINQLMDQLAGELVGQGCTCIVNDEYRACALHDLLGALLGAHAPKSDLSLLGEHASMVALKALIALSARQRAASGKQSLLEFVMAARRSTV